jgi:hypothetical protein
MTEKRRPYHRCQCVVPICLKRCLNADGSTDIILSIERRRVRLSKRKDYFATSFLAISWSLSSSPLRKAAAVAYFLGSITRLLSQRRFAVACYQRNVSWPPQFRAEGTKSFTNCDRALRAIALGVCDYLAETTGARGNWRRCPSRAPSFPL